MQLIALDSENTDYWIIAQNDSNKGYFFDEKIINDPVADVAQGTIKIGIETIKSDLSHLYRSESRSK